MLVLDLARAAVAGDVALGGDEALDLGEGLVGAVADELEPREDEEPLERRRVEASTPPSR